jgi:ATP-dependent DNA helicase RecQ
VRGLVDVDVEGYGALKLNNSCRPVLRGEATVMLRKDLAPEKGKKTKASRGDFSRHSDNILWEALRAKRRELADAQDVPPYIIFNDLCLS